MSLNNDITNGLKEMARRQQGPMPLLCTVDSVDPTTNTCYCIPLTGEADILGVRLLAQNETGFLIIPKEQEVVLVSFIDSANAYISMFSKISEIRLNGNNYGGIPQVQPLVDKINSLENLVNSILNVLKLTTIPLAPSGTYPFAPLYSTLSDIIPITIKSDLENITVNHGNGT